MNTIPLNVKQIFLRKATNMVTVKVKNATGDVATV